MPEYDWAHGVKRLFSVVASILNGGSRIKHEICKTRHIFEFVVGIIFKIIFQTENGSF